MPQLRPNTAKKKKKNIYIYTHTHTHTQSLSYFKKYNASYIGNFKVLAVIFKK